ncbi:MAG: DEAD/DEAH box helicase, partial [Myxococcales bacterium]|nr:DEAD/DEAH box helicase [Myxococcales bacterium]
MTSFSLRDYQREAIAAVLDARRQGVRRMVVSLPTGSGKTVIFSELARMAKRPVLVLAHREELLTQAREKLQRAVGPDKFVAIEQGPLRAESHAHIVVASIRSLHADRLTQLLSRIRFGLVLYDECHHAVAEDNQRVLRDLGCFDPNWRGTLLGLTATTNRADGMGLDTVFEHIIYQRSMSDLMTAGWLVKLRGFRIATAADLRGLRGGGLDFDEAELADAVDIEERNGLVARSIQELARDRRTVVFCVTVRHARNLTHALNRIGVPAGIVYGDMKPERRRQMLADFRAGKLSALTNVGVLTEGFDDPAVSCIAMARPTRSEGLYAQCVGRGTRLAEGKTDCLVLDFVDLSELSLVSLPSLFGMPGDLDLRGDDVQQSQRTWQQLQIEAPGMELEPGVITLGEIVQRAEGFDPLTRDVDPSVRAISALAWESLGAKGLALHLLRGGGRLVEILVLKKGHRGRKWQVTVAGDDVARFSRIEEAVE